MRGLIFKNLFLCRIYAIGMFLAPTILIIMSFAFNSALGEQNRIIERAFPIVISFTMTTAAECIKNDRQSSFNIYERCLPVSDRVIVRSVMLTQLIITLLSGIVVFGIYFVLDAIGYFELERQSAVIIVFTTLAVINIGAINIISASIINNFDVAGFVSTLPMCVFVLLIIINSDGDLLGNIGKITQKLNDYFVLFAVTGAVFTCLILFLCVEAAVAIRKKISR